MYIPTYTQCWRHQGSWGAMTSPPIFCIAKRKKGDKGKEEKVSKQELLKGCHQGQNIIVLAILEHLEFENFFLSANHGGRHYFSVFHVPSHFEIHFAGPDTRLLLADKKSYSRQS